MRLIGPVLASIKPHMCEAAKQELDSLIKKPKRRELCIMNGARCHSSELGDGTKIRLICHQGSDEHRGIDVDLKTPASGDGRDHDIQIRETWNGSAAIELRIDRSLVECRAHEITGKPVGECIKLPAMLAKIGDMPVESYEDHTEEMVLHLSINA